MATSLKQIIGKINENRAKKRRDEHKEYKNQKVNVNNILSRATSFRIAEAYKATRTNIIFTLSNIKDPCKKICITSATPGEGKTTTTINLAIAFAQTGSKVLLVDADMRKPRIYRYLDLERRNGLSDVLCGILDLKKAIKKSKKHNLYCITSGRIPPNPVELISSERMGEVLDELSADFDYILIDTPPATIVSDVAAMSKYVSGVILVVRQNYTIHETLGRAIETLKFANAKILGYILNDIDEVSKRYGYYKSYGGESKYGYAYSEYTYGYGSEAEIELDADKSDPNIYIQSDENYDESGDVIEKVNLKREKED